MLMTMSYFLFGIIAMKLYGDIEFDSGCKQLHWIGETNNFRTIWYGPGQRCAAVSSHSDWCHMAR
jgi:hypothetical protein